MQTQRLRFDFNLPRGMKPEEVQQVESLVNCWIQEDHTLDTHTVPLQEAKDRGKHCPPPPGLYPHPPPRVSRWLATLLSTSQLTPLALS